jgi:hypothetical protein
MFLGAPQLQETTAPPRYSDEMQLRNIQDSEKNCWRPMLFLNKGQVAALSGCISA